MNWKLKIILLTVLAVPAFSGYPLDYFHWQPVPGISTGWLLYFTAVASLLLLLLGSEAFSNALAVAALITVPVVYPIIQAMGIDPVWFGILTVLTVELGLMTPPVGMNVFVIKAMAPHVGLGEIFKGVAPFVVSDLIRLALLIAFPILSTLFLL